MERDWQFWSRRIIWLLLATATALFIVVRVKAVMYVSKPARSLYQAMEKVPPDKIIVLSCNWEAGTRGENGPQTEALVRHCFKRGKRFAIFGWNFPPGPLLAEQIARRVAPEYGRCYGRDWVNWGFKTGQANMIRAWAKNIPGVIKEDMFHTPLARIPAMRGVKTIHDVGLIVDIAPADTLSTYVRFIYGIYRTPLGHACTGVMAPESFPYLDAGQIVGLLKGLAGAAEYEKLVGYEGDALKRMPAQSSAHMLMIALIILGNVLYFRARRRGPSTHSAGSGQAGSGPSRAASRDGETPRRRLSA